MPTTVISARVDTATLRQAMRVIDASSYSLADIIKDAITNIAVTGEIPLEKRLEEARKRREEGQKKMAAFMAWRETVEWAPWLATLTDDEMKDMIASKYD